MITDQLIQKEFIRRIMTRDSAYIRNVQEKVIRDNFTNERAKNLAKYIQSHGFSVGGSDMNIWYKFPILTYLRFLDIQFSNKRKEHMGLRKHLALYNRVIWGRLYHQTIGDLMYGLTQDIKNEISQKLRDSTKS